MADSAFRRLARGGPKGVPGGGGARAGGEGRGVANGMNCTGEWIQLTKHTVKAPTYTTSANASRYRSSSHTTPLIRSLANLPRLYR